MTIVGTITWAQLGCPTEPGHVTAQGMTFKIEQRHIDVAEGEPHATFRIVAGTAVAGGRSYMLGLRID